MCLNHAVTRLDKLKVWFDPSNLIHPVTHFIDLEVIDEAGPEIAEKSSYVVAPWMPNLKHRRQFETLERLLPDYPALALLASEGRLLAYNRLGSPIVRAGMPTCSAKYFSSEAALDCLGACGVKRVMTVGIDGGTTYAKAFEDMEPLRNGRASFDDQAPELERIADKWGMKVFSFSSLVETP